MSNCNLFSTNKRLYTVIKADLLKYNDETHEFNEFVAETYSTLKKGLYGPLIAKFVTDEDVVQIVNEIVAENPDRFSAVSSSNVQEELVKKFSKSDSGIIKQFVINKNIREPFKSSQSAYDYMESDFKINIFKSAFINKEEGLIIQTNQDLNKYIIEYKNKLFNTLKEYVGNTSEQDLYGENYEVNTELYNEVMYDPKISSLANTNLNLSPILKGNRKTVLDPFNAAYILNNFDRLIKSLLTGIVNLNEDYSGFLENGVDSQKYSLTKTTLQSLYWNSDTDESKDASLYVSNLMKLIASVIPLVDANGKTVFGKYLGRNSLYKISAIIKKSEMENMKSPDFVPFISNPKKMLKHYLGSDTHEALNNNSKIVKSLYKYLYDDSPINYDGEHIRNISIESIQNSLHDNSGIKDGNLTNNIDLLGLIGFEISKIVSPEYIKYSLTEGAYKIELSSLDETTGFIKDSIKTSMLSYIGEKSGNPFLKTSVEVSGEIYDITSTGIDSLKTDVINSREFRNHFYDISGIEITNELVEKLNSKENGRAVAIIKRVAKDIKVGYNAINNGLDKISDTPENQEKEKKLLMII